MSEASIDVVLRYVEHVNAGQIEEVYNLTSEELCFIDIAGDTFHEREFMTNYMKAFPDYRIHISQALQSGRGVALIGKTSGSHVPPEVEEQETLVWTVEIAGGQITHWRIYADSSYRSGS